ncbi:hypothetical protein EBR43_03805 [bacterium]|nr:hypothetical protein [bacterium]
MDKEKLTNIVINFWKKLILEKMGMFLLIDGMTSLFFFIFFNANVSVLLIVFLSGIPKYIAGALAGAKCLYSSIDEAFKQ